MRQVEPNACSITAWPSQPAAGGRCTTTKLITEAKSSAPKPAHTTLRERA